MTLESGDLTALMGPSGSGKSTLLAILSGLMPPGEGTRRVTGAPPGEQAVSWIFQNSPGLTRRTVLDNVSLGPLSAGATRQQAEDAARSALQLLGLGDLAGTRLFRLSGGERQRAAVARCIASRADLILADEPTASLDARNRALVCQALDAAARNGSVVVVATHDQAVAQACHRVLDLPALAAA
nr:ATP-binding cassette domain-containing protein [Modestobacter muralis]